MRLKNEQNSSAPTYTAPPLHSVEVYGENAGSYEYFLFDNCHGRQIVSVLVPELAGAHAHTLTLILTHDDLDEILVPLVLVEPVHTLLCILCQLLHQRRDFIVIVPILQLFFDSCFDGRSRLSRSEFVFKWRLSLVRLVLLLACIIIIYWKRQKIIGL